ncbi:MAG: radical SAM protein [Promethearchaeota archaeon]
MKLKSKIKNILFLIKSEGILSGIITIIDISINFVRVKLKLVPKGYANPYITTIQIEPTKYCNMTCPMCPNSYMNDNEKGNMSYEDFIKIMKQFPLIKWVKLQGLGEIFLNPDIIKMIRYLKNRDVIVGFADNCTLFKQKLINTLLDLKVDFINFSLDTLNPQLFKKIRGVNLFKIVKNNIEKFAETRNNNPKFKHTKLFINMVLNNENFHELPDMVDFAYKIKIDGVIASLPQIKYLEEQQDYLKKTTNLIQNNYNHYFQIAKDKAKKYGIKLRKSSLDESFVYSCYWNFTRVYITWDGYITPCCHIENPKLFNFGNILQNSFKKIWNSPKYRYFRINHFDPKSICKLCPHLNK